MRRCRWIHRLELVDRNRRAGAPIAGLIQAREPVRGGDLIGRMSPLQGGRRLRRGTGLRSAGGHVGASERCTCTRCGPRAGRRSHQQRMRCGYRVETDHGLDQVGHAYAKRRRGGGGHGHPPVGQRQPAQRDLQAALEPGGAGDDRDRERASGHGAGVQTLRAQASCHGTDRAPGRSKAPSELGRGQVIAVDVRAGGRDRLGICLQGGRVAWLQRHRHVKPCGRGHRSAKDPAGRDHRPSPDADHCRSGRQGRDQRGRHHERAREPHRCSRCTRHRAWQPSGGRGPVAPQRRGGRCTAARLI